MSDSEINILSAEWESEYRIRLRFDDGSRQTIDFLPYPVAVPASGYPRFSGSATL